MIGGTDTTFEVHALKSDPAAILQACNVYWPNSLYQKSDEERAYPVGKILAQLPDRKIGPEFFIYKNKESYDTWMREGATSANEDTMLQFIISDTSSPGSPFFQLTMVSDTKSADVRALEALINGFLESPYNMIWAGKHEIAKPITGEVFEHSVAETRVLFFQGKSPMEIMLNPRLGLELCDMVRWRLKQPIPDNMIMQALFINAQQQ